MKTLRNIHEGFFSNVGATGALYKNKVIEYLKNINTARSKYQNTIYISPLTINDALEEINDVPDEWFNNGLGGVLAKKGEDSRQVFCLKRFFTQFLVITPDVFDSNITTLPNWFKLNDDFFSLYKSEYNASVDDSLVIYIYSMQNLDPKEVIDFLKKFKAIKGIYIVDCPKFKNFEGFPKKIGETGLTFKPSPNIKFKYRDVLKYFTDIEGPIIFNHINDNNEEKLLKKVKAKAANDAKIKTDKKVNAISNGKDITKKPKERTKIKPWNGSLEDAPVWKVDERNRVYMPDGTEFGRLTRDCTTVYRQVNKALFVKNAVYSIHPGDLIGYAYDKKDNLVCKLVRGNVKN